MKEIGESRVGEEIKRLCDKQFQLILMMHNDRLQLILEELLD